MTQTECIELKAFTNIKQNICVLKDALSPLSQLPHYPTQAPGHVTNAAPDVNHATIGLSDGKKEGASERESERLYLVMSHRCSLPPP